MVLPNIATHIEKAKDFISTFFGRCGAYKFLLVFKLDFFGLPLPLEFFGAVLFLDF